MITLTKTKKYDVIENLLATKSSNLSIIDKNLHKDQKIVKFVNYRQQIVNKISLSVYWKIVRDVEEEGRLVILL